MNITSVRLWKQLSVREGWINGNKILLVREKTFPVMATGIKELHPEDGLQAICATQLHNQTIIRTQFGKSLYDGMRQ